MELLKPKVFMILPFNDACLALYEKLRQEFKNDYEFSNAGDLDDQQNILQDIVEGIYNAEVIIADLSGMNANVFYELGLAHAMNKKVIIITQNISDLPFDIRSYRANEYSLQFNLVPDLITKLRKLLSGAIDNTIKYGNPVSDYLPDFYSKKIEPFDYKTKDDSNRKLIQPKDENGFLDYIAEIKQNTNMMNSEIKAMAGEIQETSYDISVLSDEISSIKGAGRMADLNFVKNVCRKLSSPIEVLASKLKGHTKNIYAYWNIVENNYLSLLENKLIENNNYLAPLKNTMSQLENMKHGIDSSNSKIENFITVLRGSIGLEHRLNSAIFSLISSLQSYLSTTETISSSIDRIFSKSNIVIEKMDTK